MNTNRKSNKIIDLYRVENIDEKNAEIIKKNDIVKSYMKNNEKEH